MQPLSAHRQCLTPTQYPRPSHSHVGCGGKFLLDPWLSLPPASLPSPLLGVSAHSLVQWVLARSGQQLPLLPPQTGLVDASFPLTGLSWVRQGHSPQL